MKNKRIEYDTLGPKKLILIDYGELKPKDRLKIFKLGMKKCQYKL